MQCKALRDSAVEIERFDVAYFMVSVDSLKDNTAFAEKNRADFPVLADADRTVSKAYGVLSKLGYAKRWTYFIDPAGTVLRVDREVDPRTAGADLVTHLDELEVPRIDEPETAEG